jgi:putative endonuclease
MYYTYILFSITVNKFYVGASENPHDRLKKHNAKNKGFTNQANDWQIVFIQPFETKSEALNFEKQIKNWKSSLKIRKLIQNYNDSEHPDAKQSGESGVRIPHPDTFHYSGVNSPTKLHRNVELFF